MEHFKYTAIILTIFTLLAASGCDKPKPAKPSGSNRSGQATPSNAAETTEQADQQSIEETIGVWEGKVGDPKKADSFNATMTLDIRKDNTFTLTNAMANKVDPAKPVTNKAEGHWKMEEEYLVLTLEKSLTGGEIPADQRQVKFWAASNVPGKLVSVLHLEKPTGNEFHKKTP